MYVYIYNYIDDHICIHVYTVNLQYMIVYVYKSKLSKSQLLQSPSPTATPLRCSPPLGVTTLPLSFDCLIWVTSMMMSSGN